MKAFIERSNTIDLLSILKLDNIVTDLTHIIGFLLYDHYVIMFSVFHRKPPRLVISRQISKLYYISISNFLISIFLNFPLLLPYHHHRMFLSSSNAAYIDPILHDILLIYNSRNAFSANTKSIILPTQPYNSFNILNSKHYIYMI